MEETANAPADTLAAAPETAADKDAEKAKKFEYSFQVLIIAFLVIEFFVCWLVAFLLLLPVFKFVKPVKKVIAKEQYRYVALLLGIAIAMLLNLRSGNDNSLNAKAFSLTNFGCWRPSSRHCLSD